MIPAGHMAKRVSQKPDWLVAPQVDDIYSVSSCISENFTDYIEYWKHNGYWLFDTPEIIRSVAQENAIGLEGTALFYYEVYEKEFDGELWQTYAPESSIPTNVVSPLGKRLEGFDAVTFDARGSPECSPLSCNSMAERLGTNTHCLFDSFEDAHTNIQIGAFRGQEAGPYRIFAVYSVGWR